MFATYCIIALIVYIVILQMHIRRYTWTITLRELLDGAYSDVILYSVFWIVSVPIFFLKKYKLVPFKGIWDKILNYPILKK